MVEDISDILQAWPHDEENDACIIKGKDGRYKVQLRIPFGIQQFEADGRSDGKRPYGKDSALEHYLEELDKYKKLNDTDIGFSINSEACEELREESGMTYHRYAIFYGLHDFKRVIRDTEHNMKIFDLVQAYADEQNDRNHYEQWRPYIIRMNRDAKIQLYLEKKEYKEALAIAYEARKTLRSLSPVYVQMEEDDSSLFPHPNFVEELKRSLTFMNQRIKEIKDKIGPDPIAQLKKKLAQTVQSQDFEEAAKLRDKIRELGGDSKLKFN